MRVINDTEKKFLDACGLGDLKTVQELIEQVDIDVQYFEAPLVEQDVNGTGFTGLIEASQSGRIDIVKFLLSKGASVDVQDAWGFTALSRAPNHDGIIISEELLKAGANINHQTCCGTTSLMFAADSGNKNLVSFLINKGSNLHLKNKSGETALMLSYRVSHDIATLLINYGAQLNEQNAEGETVLMMAIDSENKDLVKVLIESGADLAILNNKNKTALDMIIENKQIFGTLLEKYGLVNYQDTEGWSLLMKACQKRDEDDVFFLRKLDADFFIENDKGESAYKILKRKRSLPEKLQTLKEKLILEQSIESYIDCGPVL